MYKFLLAAILLALSDPTTLHAAPGQAIALELVVFVAAGSMESLHPSSLHMVSHRPFALHTSQFTALRQASKSGPPQQRRPPPAALDPRNLALVLLMVMTQDPGLAAVLLNVTVTMTLGAKASARTLLVVEMAVALITIVLVAKNARTPTLRNVVDRPV